MLTQLTVSNYAIAEHLELHFDRGMTALTGETGAGKSIALDALGLALGDRADAGAVRHGAERADIAATFDIHDNPDASDWLKAHDLDADDPECILRRVLGRDGRSRAYINGRPCTLQDLRDLGARLIDIHSQHHHQSLLRKDHHRRLLDEFAGAEALADAVRKAWQHWHQAHSRWQDALTHHDERDARLQLLRYQVEEFERLNLEPGEIEALEQEQSQLANAEQLLQAAHQAAQLCEEAEPGAIERVQQAIHKLESLPTELPIIAESLKMLEEARIQIEEAADNLRRFTEHFELDPQRLSDVEERLSTLYQLARKHRTTPEGLVELHAQLARELADLDGDGASLDALESAAHARLSDYQKLAMQLTERRQSASTLLDERIAQELRRLSMPHVRFVTALSPLTDASPTAHGQEDIEFLVSANPGQPPRPLSKVASGGELSRISLAIQVVVAQTSRIPTLVFDEVDVGIGGGTAEVVGRLLRALGERGQVVCVTHLPQVAAQAHQHLFVSKAVQNESTFSRISKLDAPGRVQEVARMLGGMDLTEQTLAHALEMVERGQATQH